MESKGRVGSFSLFKNPRIAHSFHLDNVDGSIRSMKKSLRRSKKERVLAGVAGGMAKYFGIDVVLVRLVWAFLLFPGGLSGLIPYLLCWLIIPEEEK